MMGLGIDLGTSYTSVAYAVGKQVRFLELNYDSTISPTIAYVDEQGGLLFGPDAELAGAARPEGLLVDLKRDIGRDDPYQVGEQVVPVRAVLTAAFSFIAGITRTRVCDFTDRTPITLTLPAQYMEHPSRVNAMVTAAVEAGFAKDVISLLPEPVAASIGYQTGDWPRPALDPGSVLLVYDLGGGTFDAAAVEISPGGDRVVGVPVGDETIGGSRFDRAILDSVLSTASPQARAAYRRPADAAERDAWRLRMTTALTACRLVKERLSVVPQVPLVVPDVESQTMTTARLEVILRPFVEVTVKLVGRLASEVESRGKTICGILLVGGSCRMPIIRSFLNNELGLPLYSAPDPARIVATGAALAAAARARRTIPRPQDVDRLTGQRSSLLKGFFDD